MPAKREDKSSCSRCNGPNDRADRGYNWCRSCQNEASKRHKESNPERVRESHRIYDEQNKDKRQAWYDANRDKLSERSKERYQNTREVAIVRAAESKVRQREADPEGFKARNREYMRQSRARRKQEAEAAQLLVQSQSGDAHK